MIERNEIGTSSAPGKAGKELNGEIPLHRKD
jgi:hypothetical protein